ncbi:hypothetical protein CI105_04105 [Candidatus Izimaplasma bacterium ZiA1]|uniref:rhodanese-like domain-containing protein n=1 Tax=Candidatus Izimoplasma sp. ZiA1 TaxID=2024899 RepID=UPI000BAA5369|nr:hypothetical protein CI105_04105 [Candidatus Izimaplasma bacterium ZiA1]
MKKMIFLLILLCFTIVLKGCTQTIKATDFDPLDGEENIRMNNLDSYMFRDDVQYVDLRNLEARFEAGYIDGFEPIPFFDYLDNNGFYRNDTYEFNKDQLIDEKLIRSFFKEDKAIFLYSDGCIRSEYIRSLLSYLGYEKVYVLGGFFEYSGNNVVEGDGKYKLGDKVYGTYLDDDSNLLYTLSATLDMGRKMIDVRFDIQDEQKNSLRSMTQNDVDYLETFTIIENLSINEMMTLYQLKLYLLDITNKEVSNDLNINVKVIDNILSLIEDVVTYTN